LKVFTVTGVAVALLENCPPTNTVPLLPRVPDPVGVRFTVTVAVAPPLRIPILQRTVLLVGVVGQLPPDAVAETKVAGAVPLPLPRLS
jgi:hypothetical protein